MNAGIGPAFPPRPLGNCMRRLTEHYPWTVHRPGNSLRDMFRLSHRTAVSRAAWVAILAVALNALWPLLAQLKPGEAPPLMQACDEAGMQHDASGGKDSPPADSSPLMPHCAFCTLASGGFAVLVAGSINAVLQLTDTEESWAAFPEVRPLALLSYSQAHPRAPPSSSDLQ